MPLIRDDAAAAPVTGTTLATKSVRQSQSRCGPACLAIVARFFGIRVCEDRLARACRTSFVSGTTGSNLVRAARRLGFRAEIIDHANFRIIARWLRKGVPVIVDWMSVARDGARGHYSVVCGLSRDEIVLEDPAIGRRHNMARREFVSVWYDFKYLFPRRGGDLVLRRAIVVAPPAFFERKAGAGDRGQEDL